MSLISPFYAWEQGLALAQKGPVTITIDRGVPFRQVWSLDWDASASTFKASLRASPDASGSTLADFTITVGSYSGGVTSLTLAMTSSTTATLPADDEGDGVVPLVFDLLETPSGGTQSRLIGGTAYVLGKVTNA